MKILTCGCAAYARNEQGQECCTLHANTEFMEVDLTGRIAKCDMCSNTQKSSENLAFFKYKPNSNTDSYYCGCWGWN